MKWSLIPLALMMAACDPTPPQSEAERPPSAVFETQIQAMEKARAAEQQLKDAAEAQRAQLESQP
ncbi:MAG: hypothetical protein A2X71_00170 [Thiobacillus sp. GWE1_62_9]|nr:MAG: hypothetical protein A2X71_00170 [Thiobacillus sp. GWE1_62_9]